MGGGAWEGFVLANQLPADKSCVLKLELNGTKPCFLHEHMIFLDTFLMVCFI